MIKHWGRGTAGSMLALVGLGLLAGCSGGDASDPHGPADTSKVVSELKSNVTRVAPEAAESTTAAKSEQDFAFALLQHLDANANVAFSPHSISTAFAMLTDAAGGQTLAEVEQTLHFGATNEAFHRSQDALTLALSARNRAAIHDENHDVAAQTLVQSNDIWIRNDAPPEPTYLDTLARFYGAGVHVADFGSYPEESRRAINGKVSADTHELISELIPKGIIDPSTLAVLTNALYFKAPWASAFDEPKPGDFKHLDGSTSQAALMVNEASLAYYPGNGYASVAVPYYGSDLELLLVVPDAGHYDDVRAQLTSDELTRITTERQSTLVRLTLPKFKLHSVVPAKLKLQELGMVAPFKDGQAEFPKLLGPNGERVFISDVLHQADISVDEKGSEAAAATAVVLGVGSSVGPIERPQPTLVTADRPFLFVIRDNPTGATLFVGQVVAP